MFDAKSVFPPPAQSNTRYLYAEARIRGRVQRLLALFKRQSRRLLVLSDIDAAYEITNRYNIGIQTIPIRQIRGSENRANDFDANFCPLSDRTVYRWTSIAEAQLQGKPMPPIEVIQVGDIYFVRDGHHRISVARTMGQQEIEAIVLVWKVDVRSTLHGDTALKRQTLTA
jgi:uncharacterized ParB-like nuclease family protein